MKDRKKTDKTIVDSQERAFWRVMRPSVKFELFLLQTFFFFFRLQPDETSVLEMDIRNDLFSFRPMKRDEALKRRVSSNFPTNFKSEDNEDIFSARISPTGFD